MTEAAGATREELIVQAAFARFDLVALAIAVGSVGALALWTATAVLLIKGPEPGSTVGPHLALLSYFLPGYSVSWSGSLIGLVWGLLLGGALGAVNSSP